MRKVFCVLSTLCFVSSALANAAIPHVQDNIWQTHDVQQNALAKAGVFDSTDDLTDEQRLEHVELSVAELHEAKVWGLTAEEEKRYLKLMKNKSAVYYEGRNLSPIDILGLNAQSDAERAHYAELSAKYEALKVAQNIAWNNAFHEAYKKLFEGVPVVGDFNPAPYSPHAYRPIKLLQGEMLYLFVDAKDQAQTILMVLKGAILETPNTRLHVFFLHMNNTDIHNWAKRHEIPEDLVKQKRITLNQGQLAFEALPIPKKSTPFLLQGSGKTASVVDLGRF